MYPMIFSLLREFLSSWNPSGAYISLATLTGRQPQADPAREIPSVLCIGTGSASTSHMVHRGEVLTCAVCASYICHAHSHLLRGRRLCADCFLGAQNLETSPMVEATTPAPESGSRSTSGQVAQMARGMAENNRQASIPANAGRAFFVSDSIPDREVA